MKDRRGVFIKAAEGVAACAEAVCAAGDVPAEGRQATRAGSGRERTHVIRMVRRLFEWVFNNKRFTNILR